MSYEVEHNVTLSDPKKSIRPDMSTFTTRFAESHPSTPPSRPTSTPTPASNSDLFRLLTDQLSTLYTTSTSESHRAHLESLLAVSTSATQDPPRTISGVSQEFLDGLERVPKAELRKEEECGICGESFVEQEWPLVVRLPCGEGVRHDFDLECVGPWLRLNGTCPMDRRDLTKKKVVVVEKIEEEEEWDADYA